MLVGACVDSYVRVQVLVGADVGEDEGVLCPLCVQVSVCTCVLVVVCLLECVCGGQ